MCKCSWLKIVNSLSVKIAKVKIWSKSRLWFYCIEKWSASNVALLEFSYSVFSIKTGMVKTADIIAGLIVSGIFPMSLNIHCVTVSFQHCVWSVWGFNRFESHDCKIAVQLCVCHCNVCTKFGHIGYLYHWQTLITHTHMDFGFWLVIL